jgi:YD repeat-containing protein
MERFGNVTRTHTVSLFGGVDIEPRIVVWPDDGVAKKMRAEAEKSRPSHSVAKWDVVEDHKDIMALAIRVGVLSTPFGESSDDHTFRTQDINSFMRIRRMYDSTSLRKGDFGPGWFLWVPYSISVVAHDGKRDEVLTLDEKATRSKPEAILVLRDHTRGDSYMLRRVADIDSSGRLAYCKVAEQTVHDGSVSFQYDPSFVLYRLDVGFLFEKDSVGYVFDRAGYLREISKDGRRAIRYERNEVRIQQILGDPDYHYVFEYEPSDKGTRIVKITASDGHVLWYEYDRRGCLAGWREGPNRRANYSYDVHCRLTERRDAEGRLVVRNIYDDFGRRVSVSDVVTTGSGKKIQRSIQEGRLMQIRDERGSYVSYRYDTYNNLSKIEAHNAVGARWEMAFDAKGRLIQFVGCNRCRWIISYDHEGRVNKIVDPHGRPRVFGWGNGSRLVQVRDHRGRTQSAEYDIAGLIRCLATSGGAAWTFDYDRGSVLEVKGPLGRMRTNVTEQLAGISTRSAIGVRSKYTHDTRLRCLETRSTGRGRLCVEYDTNGHVSRVRTEAGLMEYQVHEDSLIIEARLTYP